MHTTTSAIGKTATHTMRKRIRCAISGRRSIKRKRACKSDALSVNPEGARYQIIHGHLKLLGILTGWRHATL